MCSAADNFFVVKPIYFDKIVFYFRISRQCGLLYTSVYLNKLHSERNCGNEMSQFINLWECCFLEQKRQNAFGKVEKADNFSFNMVENARQDPICHEMECAFFIFATGFTFIECTCNCKFCIVSLLIQYQMHCKDKIPI